MSNTAAITNGNVENTAITTTKVDTKGSNSLGKDAFLQLLVAQMKYQDPLEPSSNTEWIAQLAQFSSLEEMQNMGSTLSNTQAFTMVGKTVEITTDTKPVQGVVDYVTVSGSKAYVSVNGTLYEADKVASILGDNYLQKVYGPSAPEQDITYNYDNPMDAKISVSLGKDSYAATGMYVAINNELVDSSYLSYDSEKEILTVDADAFYGLASGQTYDVALIFDDSASTTVTGKVKLKVTGKQPADAIEKEETSAEEPVADTDSKQTGETTETSKEKPATTA